MEHSPLSSSPPPGDSPQVLIVGAGPVGIALACELLQQGVRIRLIDRRTGIDESDPHSKGILVWPRSLEMLRRIGVGDRLAEAGHRSEGVNYYSEGRLRGTAHLHKLPDSPYPFVLTLAQRDTERVLRARLAELGGTIEFGVSLMDLDTSGDLPRATLVGSGAAETVTPLYLVGADGPGSMTRELLGIGFEGEPIDVTYAIGDAPIGGDVPANAQYYYSRDGVVALVPLANGYYRIAANIPHRGDAEENPSAQLLEEVINRRAHTRFTVGEPLWTRSFRPRLGLAERFSHGRCFLVGDAAHVISPAGGQGMNIGFQDAANLGWKLGGVVQGRLHEVILNTYHAERSVGAVRMSKTSAAQAKFAMQRKRLRIAVRDAVFVTARWTGLLQNILVPLLAQSDVDYTETASDPLFRRIPHPARPGQRVPLFTGPGAAEPGGVPQIDPYRHTVVLWPGRRTPSDWQATVAGLRRRFAGQAPVLDLGEAPAAAARWLGRAFGGKPVIATVRPDGHLAHLAAVTAPEQTQSYLRGIAPEHSPAQRLAPASA